MRKVWAYLSSKALSETECKALLEAGNHFVSNWTAHETKLEAQFEIFKNRIIVVSVDESAHNASGCSIDKLLRFVKDAEKQFGIELLNRLLVAVDAGTNIEVYKSSQIPALLAEGKLNASSSIYNTSVSTEAELNNWLQPLGTTWLSKYLQA